MFSALSVEVNCGPSEGDTTHTSFSLRLPERAYALTAEWLEGALVVTVAGDCERATLAAALQWVGEQIFAEAKPSYLAEVTSTASDEKGLPAQAYGDYDSEEESYDPEDWEEPPERADEPFLELAEQGDRILAKLDLLLERTSKLVVDSTSPLVGEPAPPKNDNLSAKKAKAQYDRMSEAEKEKVREECRGIVCITCGALTMDPCHRKGSPESQLQHPHPERIRWALRKRLREEA
jgi:hypothetical protein